MWLKRNNRRLRAPVRAHLGASLNFEAGVVKRAPALMRKSGLEWLWRIKEEPYLWRRYWHDGRTLLSLLSLHVLPLCIYNLTSRKLSERQLTLKSERRADCIKLKFSGAATTKNIDEIVAAFRTTLSASKCVVIDLSDVSVIDQRFLGALLVLRKMLRSNQAELVLTGVSRKLGRVFRLSGVDFLLTQIDKDAKTDETLRSAKAQLLVN